MENFWQAINLNMPVIILFLGLLVTIIVIGQFILHRRFREVSRRYKLLTRGPAGADLEQILLKYAEDVKSLEETNKNLMREQEILKEQIAQGLHNPGLVRFNAFDNMGSDLSFSLALLDRRGDGVILTGLYGRDETRLYAKPIRKGSSDYSLTEEEQKAVQKTTGGKNE
ncbi:hypothetical protein N752_24250 [Desulforamulus aquiferis]|nr:DUF4446 family protein [Desulforamulus aquiferis]RYD02445.1 hypothetical protein N752_24250 [Desulforamulus aquiferis]